VRYTIEPLLGLIHGERAGGRGVSDAERARVSSEELGMGRHWIDAWRGPSHDAVNDAPLAPYPARLCDCTKLTLDSFDRPTEPTQPNTHKAIAAGCAHRDTARVCTGAIGG
jgi:hypothetical protein